MVLIVPVVVKIQYVCIYIHDSFVNPRRACAARVTVVGLCVSVHGSSLLVAQLRDKLVILTGSVSWSLQNQFGVFRIMASFRR